MATPPFRTSDEELLKEIQAAAEVRLSAQLTAALAADQRALIVAGFLVTVTLASGGAAASVLLTKQAAAWLGWIALCVSVGFGLAAAIAIHSARPVHWYYPGGNPGAWISDIDAQKDRLSRLQEIVSDYKDRIDENGRLMKRNGYLMWIALRITVLTVGISCSALIVGNITDQYNKSYAATIKADAMMPSLQKCHRGA